MSRNPGPRGDSYAARIRAAAGFADLDRRQLGDELGVSPETVTRLFSGAKVSDEPLRQRIADICEVPRWFMESGYDVPPEPEEPTLAERIEALEQQMVTLLAQLSQRLPPEAGGQDR